MPSDEVQLPILPSLETGMMTDSIGIDDQSIFNDLLHFLTEQTSSTDIAADANLCPYPNMNFNANYGMCPQDFSQFNDIQFNILFNENQMAQSEQQDSNIQVKTEEELWSRRSTLFFSKEFFLHLRLVLISTCMDQVRSA